MTTRETLRWQLNIKLLLLVGLLVPVMLKAGFWQLDRAQQKRERQQQIQQAESQPTVPLNTLTIKDRSNYRAVEVEGIWSDKWFLLDNRTRNGRIGFEVIGVLERINAPSVLINRGWVTGGKDRTTMPKITFLSGVQKVQGRIFIAPQSRQDKPGQALQGDWPTVIDQIQISAMQQMLGHDVYENIIRIESFDTQSFKTQWSLKQSGPTMHLGYAFQWFSMAIISLLLLLFANSNLWQWLRQIFNNNNHQ